MHASDSNPLAEAPRTESIAIVHGLPDDEAACRSARARNRRDTWLSIHAAAFDLVRERGLAAATVEEIVERAGVSRRTFFNYFPTKEDAVLGLVEPHLPPDAIERFEASVDDPFRGTVRLMVDILRAAFPRTETMRDRRLLADSRPELLARLRDRMQGAEELAGEVLEKHLDAIRPTGARPEGVSREDAGRALLLVAGGVMKLASRRSPESIFDDDGASIDSAIDVFRYVIKETL